MITKDGTAGNDVGSKSESRRHVVTTGLGNDAYRLWEELVDGRPQDRGNLLEGDAVLNVGARETTTHIQQGKVVPNLGSLIKDLASANDSVAKGVLVKTATANMEASINKRK